MKANASKRPWPPNLQYHGVCSVTRQLVEWCSLNIHCKRRFKQKQLYLHGPPNTLKTKFLRILTKYCSTYEFPATEDYFDLYPDPEPQLCCIDEFKQSPITIQTWNQLLQGSTPTRPLTLKQKGKQGLKKSNPPCIIISNFTLEEVFKGALSKNPQALQPLIPRLLIVEVTQPLDIVGFKEALASATYATIPPPVSVSDAEMTNVLSTLMTLEDSQEIFETSSNSPSPPSSPEEHLPRRSKRSREKEPESPLWTDSTTSSQSNSQTALINDVLDVEELINPAPSSTALTVESTRTTQEGISTASNAMRSEEIYSKFKRLRKTYDDYLLD